MKDEKTLNPVSTEVEKKPNTNKRRPNRRKKQQVVVEPKIEPKQLKKLTLLERIVVWFKGLKFTWK